MREKRLKKLNTFQPKWLRTWNGIRIRSLPCVNHSTVNKVYSDPKVRKTTCFGLSKCMSYPGEAYASDSATEHGGDDGWVRVGCREVGVETRWVPVRDAGHDDLLDVGHDVLPLVRRLWSLGRQQGTQVSWLHSWQHFPTQRTLMKITVFWDMTPCSVAQFNRLCRGSS